MHAISLDPARALFATKHFTTRQLCIMGAAGAASFCLMLLKLPTPFAPFLKYDPSDVPPILCALAMGPAAGFMTVLVRVLLRLMTMVADPVGLAMNLVASGSFVLVTGGLNQGRTSRASQIRALVAATSVMTLLMLPVNQVVLARGGYVPDGDISRFLCVAIAPFNIVKGLTNSILALLLWRQLSPLRAVNAQASP